MSFNYFSNTVGHAATYAKFRPTPPAGLIQEIIKFTKETMMSLNTAIDVGCGSGQSTDVLAPHFQSVIGFDSSMDIIAETKKTSHLCNVDFRVSSAEELPVASESVDLVTTVQAVHWFELPKFYAEVNRVLKKKGGVLAIYGYNLPELVGSDDAANLIKMYYTVKLKDFVLDGSRKVYLDNYRNPEYNEVPFVEASHMIRKEGFSTEMNVTLSDITGYVSTWSGFQNFIKQKGEKEAETLLSQFQSDLTDLLGKNPDDPVQVRYRYFLLMGRKI